ncbi:MAG: ATP-binding protein [Caldilineaceae bacterium]
MDDQFSAYEVGLTKLFADLDPGRARYAEARTLEARLRENLAASRTQGDSESRRADRSQIVGALNDLAQALGQRSFNDLCWPAQQLNEQGLHGSLQTGGVNPFQYGNPVAPEQFYGREAELALIRDRLGKLTPESLSLVGHRRMGKSSLLRYIAARPLTFCRPEQRPLFVSLDLQDRRFHTPIGITEGLRRGIERATGTAPWATSENDDLFAVDDGLTALRDQGWTLIMLIDEFDRIGARLAAFQDWGEDWRAKASVGKLVLVIASLQPLDTLYQTLGLTSPFANIFITATLGALAPAAQEALVRAGFAQSGHALPAAGLTLVDELAGGFPYYTQLAAGLLWRLGDPATVRQEFMHQATPRFRELWADLTPLEQQTLRNLSSQQGVALPDAKLLAELQRQGLVRNNHHPFSTAFADFICKP